MGKGLKHFIKTSVDLIQGVNAISYLFFYDSKLIKKVEVQPLDRIRVMYDMIKTIGQKEMGPCGGFTHMYACMCDFHGLVYRDEVAWVRKCLFLNL